MRWPRHGITAVVCGLPLADATAVAGAGLLAVRFARFRHVRPTEA